MLGIDASSWQAGSTIIKAMNGSSFVIAKATQGLNYQDPRHTWLAPYARRHHWLLGHYHFADQDASPVAQAHYFLDYAKPRAGEVVALDLESRYPADRPDPAWAVAFLDTVKTRCGAPCWLYVNGDWAQRIQSSATRSQWQQITSYPLWIAAWNNNPGQADAYGWPVITCHQYADQPLTDRDHVNGGTAVWEALAVPSPKRATPKPPPPAPNPTGHPHVTVTVPGLAQPVTIDLQKGTK